MLAASIVDRVLMIEGTDFRDGIYVEIAPVELRVQMKADGSGTTPTMQWFMLADFDTIRVNSAGHQDRIEFSSVWSLGRPGGNLSKPLYIHSGGGDDRILIRSGLLLGTVHIFAGGGNDRIDILSAGSQNRSTLRTMAYGEGGNDTILVLDGALRASGGSGNDTIIGGNQTDILYGEGGDDVIDAAKGNATIHGGTGHDSLRARDGVLDLRGGLGRDALYAYGPKSLLMYGGADDDELRVAGPIWGSSLLDGGTGHDRLNAMFAVVGGVSLIGGGSGDTLIGSEYSDNFYGQGGHDWIYGMGGNDYIDPDDDHVIV
jgi:Ca2+-binding RTX toxin-like protein